jgi:hypothetical protein
MTGANQKAEKYARYRRWWAGLSQSERAAYGNRSAPEPDLFEDRVERLRWMLKDSRRISEWARSRRRGFE